MDCRSLLREFEDLNNNPIVVYNNLSYSQQTASGVKQVPYKLPSKSSQSSGLHSSSVGFQKQERIEKLAINIAQTSKIKTEAILARELIKMQNKNATHLSYKRRFLNQDLIHHNRSSLNKSGLYSEEHSVQEPSEVPMSAPGGEVNPEQFPTINPDFRLKTAYRTGGERNKDSRLQRGAHVFSHEEKRSPSPLMNKSFSPKFRQFKSKNLFFARDLKRPATNMDSVLNKIYLQTPMWSEPERKISMGLRSKRKQDQQRVVSPHIDPSIVPDINISKEGDVAPKKSAGESQLQKDGVISDGQSPAQSKRQKRRLKMALLSNSIHFEQMARIDSICDRVRSKKSQSPKLKTIHRRPNEKILSQPVSPLAQYAHFAKQWSQAPISPKNIDQKSHKINELIPKPLFPAKSSARSPANRLEDVDAPPLRSKREAFDKKPAIIRNGQLIESYDPMVSSTQRKLVLFQIYNQRAMTAQESARLRGLKK